MKPRDLSKTSQCEMKKQLCPTPTTIICYRATKANVGTVVPTKARKIQLISEGPNQTSYVSFPIKSAEEKKNGKRKGHQRIKKTTYGHFFDPTSVYAGSLFRCKSCGKIFRCRFSVRMHVKMHCTEMCCTTRHGFHFVQEGDSYEICSEDDLDSKSDYDGKVLTRWSKRWEYPETPIGQDFVSRSTLEVDELTSALQKINTGSST